MTQYDNNNRGVLFKNDKRESENQPLYRGNINVDGTDYWISAWVKKSAKGDSFMSLSVSPKEASNYAPAPVRKPSHDAAKARQLPPQRGGFEDMESDIPF